MRLLVSVLVFGLVAVSFVVFADYRDAPLKTVYEVEVRSYRVSGYVPGKTEGVAGVALEGFPKEDSDLEGVRLRIDGDKLLWNGKQELPDGNRVVLTVNPKIQAFVGAKASSFVGVDSVGYFVPAESGMPDTYVYKTLDQPIGVNLEVLLDEYSQEGRIKAAINFVSTTIGRRAKLPGVSLNVGMPFVSVSTVNTNVLLELDRWSHLGGVSGVSGPTVIILIKVKKAEGRG